MCVVIFQNLEKDTGHQLKKYSGMNSIVVATSIDLKGCFGYCDTNCANGKDNRPSLRISKQHRLYREKQEPIFNSFIHNGGWILVQGIC